MKRRFRLSIGERGIRKDVAHEIQFHIDMRARELMDAGMDPEQARAQAVATFGDVPRFTEACESESRKRVHRAAWKERADTVLQDVRYAIRTLARSPGYTATALVTLALGIGANSAMFSVVDGALLRQPPYANARQLAVVEHPVPSLQIQNLAFSPIQVSEFRAGTPAFDQVAEYHSMAFDLLGHGDPRRVQTGVVSADFFNVLGVKPYLGRTFAPGEDAMGAQPVLVLSHKFWVDQLGADSTIVGKSFTMNDRQHLVIGVLPPLPAYPDANEVWMPTSSCPFRSSAQVRDSRTARMVSVIGRLAPGHTLAEAQRELAVVEARGHAAHPDDYKGVKDATILASPVRVAMKSGADSAFLILLGIAALVLLIACANVAHLTLARQLRREREFAIRGALGAGRARIVRQIITESILLSLAGSAIALVLAWASVGALSRVAANFTSRASEIVLDWRVVVFTLGIAVATGVIFGVVPALGDRSDLATRLREGGHATSSSGKVRVRSMLVMAEVALAFVVLVGAGLMIRTFEGLVRTDVGYDPEHVVTAHLDLNFTKYATPQQDRQFDDALLARLRQQPGVKTVAIASEFPASSSSPQNLNAFDIVGRPAADSAHQPKAEFSNVTPSYFATVGTRILAGRDFTDADRDSAGLVTIISQSAAHKFFGGQNPVGQRVSIPGAKNLELTIIGVSGDVRQFGPAADVSEQLYIPFQRFTVRDARLLVRSSAPTGATTNLIKDAVHALDQNQPVIDFRTLSAARDDAMGPWRLTTILLALFAAVALAIAAAGLGGIVAYSVGQRTEEFGIRLALGAEPSAVRWLILSDGLRLVAVGLAIGLAAAIGSLGLMSRVLVGVRPTDPPTYGAVAAVFLAVGLVACLVPARRATTIDPASVLKGA